MMSVVASQPFNFDPNGELRRIMEQLAEQTQLARQTMPVVDLQARMNQILEPLFSDSIREIQSSFRAALEPLAQQLSTVFKDLDLQQVLVTPPTAATSAEILPPSAVGEGADGELPTPGAVVQWAGVYGMVYAMVESAVGDQIRSQFGVHAVSLLAFLTLVLLDAASRND